MSLSRNASDALRSISNEATIMKPLSLAAVLLALVAAAPSQGAELTKVTLVQMHPSIGIGEEVFLYAVPKRLGYFEAEGLDVSIQGATGGGPAAQVVQSGTAQFGTSMPESVLQVREQGGDVKAFYNLKRNNGNVIIVLKDSPIQKLEDLKGKTIGAPSFGAGGGLALKTNLLQFGITPDQYSAVATLGPAAVAALRSKQIDALVVWDAMYAVAENTGLALRTLNIPVQDKLAAMTLVTSDKFAAANPKAVAGMCRAAAKGLHFVMSNPEAAIKIFWEEFPTTKPAGDEQTAMRNQLHIMNRWLEMGEQGLSYGAKTGEFLPAAWDTSREFYKATGVLKGTKPASDGYTTSFLDQCNDFDRAAIAAAARKG
jgi:NitT/TauT family transport system substrate-binding protein